MTTDNCSASTSNPLPENEDFISPPQLVDRMDPKMIEAAIEGNKNYPQIFIELSNHQVKRTIRNETVLHIATEFNRMEFATLCIEKYRPLLSLVNSSADTALHVAAREGHTEMVKLFLRHNDLNLTRKMNSEDDTALHCCARRGNTECVKLLVEADPEVCGFLNKAHESPLYLSITSRSRYWDVVTMTKRIIDCAGSLATHKGPNGLTTLHATVLSVESNLKSKVVVEITSRIKLLGIDWINDLLVKWRREMIREGDNLGMTPLHYAAFYGKTETVQLFLKSDSDAIYCLNNDGQSALHVAAFSGKAEVLKELVKWCPDYYNMVDKRGRTILHAAVLGDQHGVVKFILETASHSRLINKVDKDGNSPMHLAANFKSYKIIKSLRCKEAKFYPNHNFYTPLDVYQNEFDKLTDLQQLEAKDISKAITVCWYLERNNGVVGRHECAKEELKRMNGEVTNSTEEISLRNVQNKSAEGKRADYGVETSLEVNLLVAMLVATVTFAAGFTVPGGLVNDGVDEGLATLTNKPTFKAFVVFNTSAFCCSIYGVLIHFTTSLRHPGSRVYYKGIAASFIAMAIIAMVLAFFFGTYVVLTKSTALSLVPFCILASFLLLYPISLILNMWFKLRTFLGSDLDEIPLFAIVKLYMAARKFQQDEDDSRKAHKAASSDL